jgi:hypothetical protein
VTAFSIRLSLGLAILCAGCSSSKDVWDQPAGTVIQTTCHGFVADQAMLASLPPESVAGRCFYIPEALTVTNWVDGETAMAESNSLLIESVLSWSSSAIPGGLFLGETPYTYRDLEGKLRSITRLRDLHVRNVS